MSYTSFSIARPGRAYTELPWVPMNGTPHHPTFEILGEGNAETLIGGFAAGIGKFINVNKYPDVEHQLGSSPGLQRSSCLKLSPQGRSCPLRK